MMAVMWMKVVEIHLCTNSGVHDSALPGNIITGMLFNNVLHFTNHMMFQKALEKNLQKHKKGLDLVRDFKVFTHYS